MSLTPDYVDRQLFATISAIIVGVFFGSFTSEWSKSINQGSFK